MKEIIARAEAPVSRELQEKIITARAKQWYVRVKEWEKSWKR